LFPDGTVGGKEWKQAAQSTKSEKLDTKMQSETGETEASKQQDIFEQR
jgi:hypothetical protein